MRPRGYMHLFDPYTVFKWQSPNFYRKQGYAYEKLAQHRHVDWFERVWSGDYDDRYIVSIIKKKLVNDMLTLSVSVCL